MSTTCGCEHCHSHGSSGLWMPTISFVLLVIGLIGKYSGISWFAESWIEAIWFLVAFLPVAVCFLTEAIYYSGLLVASVIYLKKASWQNKRI